MKLLSLLASLLAPLALAVLLATPAAAGGGQVGGGGVNTGSKFKCASGHTVKNPKACKENGGTK
jgi:hypothetical protein